MSLLTAIEALAASVRGARTAREPASAPQYRPRKPDAPSVLILSPHPDDECIVGGLALRLGLECGWRVVNVAVTHGSNPERQLERGLELRAACGYLGFECVFFQERGLAGINAPARRSDPAAWRRSVAALADVLAREAPTLILAPHAHDAQSTHVGTHLLLLDALAQLPPTYTPQIAWTEYWSTMETPNLMVELSAQHVSQLVSGLYCHAGEIARNPYHATLPLWMMESVRRGSERVGPPGGIAADFDFATLYTLAQWDGTRALPIPGPGRVVSLQASVHAATVAPAV